MLSEADFLDVVRLTPLVSIDLIVTDGTRRVLVGQRRNRPAQGTWFVPGGRIKKDESIDTAFTRIVNDELGVASVERSSSRLYGVYEHRYADNFAGAPGITTHYIVIAYAMNLSRLSLGNYGEHPARYVDRSRCREGGKWDLSPGKPSLPWHLPPV